MLAWGGGGGGDPPRYLFPIQAQACPSMWGNKAELLAFRHACLPREGGHDPPTAWRRWPLNCQPPLGQDKPATGYCLRTPPRGGGVVWGPGQPPPTHPPTSENFPQAKNEMYQRGWKFEADLRCTNFFLASDPLCDIPSGCCSFTGPWTVARSSLRMLRRVAAFCRPLRPVLLLVSFPRSRSPVVGVLGLC